jgi:hypothetical protein
MTRTSSCANDRALHDTSGFQIALGEQAVEFLFAELLTRLVAERVLASLAQGLAPVLDYGTEGTLAGAVADEPLVVLQFDIVTVDVDPRQPRGAMGGNRR